MISQRTYSQLLQSHFPVFLQKTFAHLNPGETFKDNWHIDAMCHALSEVKAGRVRRQLITVPPRHLKSITVSVAFPAWVLGHDPSQKFLVASYGSELAAKLSRDFRSVIEAPWYKMAFPQAGVAARITNEEVTTRQGGGRKAVSVGGATTGFGADYIIVDDLMKALDATSPGARQTAIDYYQASLISRLNDQKKGRIIVIAQRLHEADVPGHCIETGLFEHLDLPAIAQEAKTYQLGSGRSHAVSPGDLLFPTHLDRPTLDQLRVELGPTVFSAQYLQDPTPAESNLIRWEEIGRYEEPPPRNRLQYVVQSWDTALTAEARSDFSVCTTWGLHNGVWFLLDLQRFRATYTDLLDRVRALRNQWRANLLLIEAAGSGRPLLDDLAKEMRSGPYTRESPFWHTRSYIPKGGKIERFAARAATLQTGKAIFPKCAPWLEALRKEMTAFPNGAYDDQVDSISQFLDYTVRTPGILIMEQNPDWRPNSRIMPPRPP